MKIRRISVYQIDLPLKESYSLSGGRLVTDRLDSTFVRIDTDCGLEGWGEGCPWGHAYLPAHGQGLRASLDVLAPSLLGRDPRALETINRVMDARLPGHLYAKSPIDMACWDLVGKATGEPLWRLFGGEEPVPVEINSSIPTGTPATMVAGIERARREGYRTHSAKLGGHDAAADIERIEAIEDALVTGEQITWDINRAWTPAIALEVLNTVSSMASVEQPCETLEQCAMVARKVRQPVLLDECLHDLRDHLLAWRAGVFAGIKVKPNRLGGLTRARRIRDLAIDVGWKMHIEDVGGSALADTAAVHLATSTPRPHRLPSWPAHAHLACDPVPGQGVRNHGGFLVPTGHPGTGVVPDEGHTGPPVAVYS